MKAKPRDPFILKLERKPDGTERQVVGAYLLRPLADRLSMRAAYSGISRSQLIETALLNYFENHPLKQETLVQHFSCRANEEWQSFCRANSSKVGWNHKEQLTTYKNMLEKTMKKRGILPEIIHRTLERIA